MLYNKNMINNLDSVIYQSPIGDLELASYQDQLCLCNWHNKKNKLNIRKRLAKFLTTSDVIATSRVINETIKQLDAYFAGELTQFELPIFLAGTEFQQRVWQTLQTIPYGQTISYLDLARKLRHDKAIRAVANANAANALSIIVPCHRIIGSDGKLTGYAGGLEAKRQLLELEQRH